MPLLWLEDLKRVKHMHLKDGLTVDGLVSEMNECGVLGAGKIGKAAEIVTEMFGDRDYTVFLTLAGPLVPGAAWYVTESPDMALKKVTFSVLLDTK